MNFRQVKRVSAREATSIIMYYVPLTSDFLRSSFMTQLVLAFQCHGLDHALHKLERIIGEYNAVPKVKFSSKLRRVQVIMPQERFQAIRTHFTDLLLTNCLGLLGRPCRGSGKVSIAHCVVYGELDNLRVCCVTCDPKGFVTSKYIINPDRRRLWLQTHGNTAEASCPVCAIKIHISDTDWHTCRNVSYL
jgi:hypothetical protein